MSALNVQIIVLFLGYQKKLFASQKQRTLYHYIVNQVEPLMLQFH